MCFPAFVPLGPQNGTLCHDLSHFDERVDADRAERQARALLMSTCFEFVDRHTSHVTGYIWQLIVFCSLVQVLRMFTGTGT